MGHQLLTLLDQDPDKTQVELDDASLRSLYEALLLTRLLDASCVQLQGEGRVGFYVPSLPAAASSAGAAVALAGNDWLFPSFRDAAAFVARGGTVDQFLAQVLGSEGDLVKGRQLPGHGSLPNGRFVSVSGLAGAQLQQAAGVALAMQCRGDDAVSLALFGPAAAEQAGFSAALLAAARHELPLVLVYRSRVGAQPLAVAAMPTTRVDGEDCLAVANEVRKARSRAAEGGGPALIEAVVSDADTGEADPVSRFRTFVEHRGLWDAEREEEFVRRSKERIRRALAAIGDSCPATATLFEDVWEDMPWMLRQQAAARGEELRDRDE
jgi:TPP-dependent pyruvate/acetoin dehydrogenase alpha subunit